MSGLLNNEGVLKVPPTFTHIFEKTSITNIDYEFGAKKSCFKGDKYHKVKIRMKKDGLTTYQEFYSNDMNDLVKQVNEFVKHLK